MELSLPGAKVPRSESSSIRSDVLLPCQQWPDINLKAIKVVVNVCYSEFVMARYFDNNFTSYNTSEDFVNESLGSSACALLSELGETSCSEVKCEPRETAVAPTQCVQNDKCHQGKNTKSESDFRILSESAGQGGLRAGSSDGLRASKKRRMYRNGKEVSKVFSFFDSDDDFIEPKYSLPSAQRTDKTCKDSLISTGKSHQTVPHTFQSMETSSDVPPRSEFLFQQLDAELPSAPRTNQSRDRSVVASANGDEFGVYGLVDSFFGDLSSSKQHQEKSSRNTCNKMKFTKIKRKPSAEYPSSTLPSASSASASAKNTVKAGNINNEVQPNVTSDVFARFFDDPWDISGTGNVVSSEDAETLTYCSGGRAASVAVPGTKQQRSKQKRQISDGYCFNETFDVPDAQNKEVSQSSTVDFPDSTFTNVMERPKSVSNLKPRTEKSTSTRRLSYVTATQSETLSCENSCIPGMDVDRTNFTGSGLRDSECKDYRDQTGVIAGKLSAAVSSVPDARAGSESVVASNPYCRKRSRLYHTSSLASSSHSSSVQHNIASSHSSASSVFNQSEGAKNSELHDSGPRCHLGTAVVENSREPSAIRDQISGRDTSSNLHMVKKRSRSHATANGHSQNAAASVSGDGPGKCHLKRKALHSRRIVYDDDDDDSEGLARSIRDNFCTGENATRHTAESAVSSSDKVVIIGSDDEEAARAEQTSKQSTDSSAGQQGNNVEPGVTAAEGGNSGSFFGRNLSMLQQRRTARMSCQSG